MLKPAGVFLLIGLLFGTLYTLVIIVSPQTVANSTLEARADMTLAGIQEQGAAETILTYARHMGVFGLTSNIAMFFVFFMGFRKAQKWAWWAFLLVGGIAWIFGLVTQIGEGDKMNLIGHVIGILLWLIGILLPIRVFFPKKA
jgi:hypothetical protein